MIIAHSAQRARWLSTISYPTRARGIIVNYNIASRAAQSNFSIRERAQNPNSAR